MENTNFTPGPWKIRSRGMSNVVSETGRPIATAGNYLNNNDVEGTDAENEANAKLIAAAPEMYKALEFVMKELASVIHPKAVQYSAGIEMASKALAKARGETLQNSPPTYPQTTDTNQEPA